MARSGYPAEFHQRVLGLLAAGRRVADVARDLGISDQTVYNWRRQERIDQGLEIGLTSGERAELLAARRRIRELEAELAIQRACRHDAAGEKEDGRVVCLACSHRDLLPLLKCFDAANK